MNSTTRRHFLRTCSAAAGAGLLQACGTGTTTTPQTKTTSTTAKAKTVQPKQPHPPRSGDNLLRVVAPSGFAEDPNRVTTGLTRLYNAGFTVTNQQAGSRRYQRFAGSDAQRAADFQEVASGRVETPKILMGLRGGYGAARILPQIDFASLGARMRERGTLFFGFSDVCAVQLALLAKGNMMSFAGPMVYSEFGKADPSVFTMDSFIRGTTNNVNIVDVPTIQRADVNVEGTLWGGNLSVLASLAGTPYMPDIQGGILFIEDVSEQPYRIERMLNTLYLSGVCKTTRHHLRRFPHGHHPRRVRLQLRLLRRRQPHFAHRQDSCVDRLPIRPHHQQNHFPVGCACQSPQYRQRRLFRHLQRLSYVEPVRADAQQPAAASYSDLRQHHLPRQHH